MLTVRNYISKMGNPYS